MNKLYGAVACFLHVCLSGCLDYIKLEEDSPLGETYHFAPVIDTKHLSPHPSRLTDAMGVGENCRGVIFQVPPIEDRNRKDRLYYLWFIDNKLARPQSVIEPHARNTAIITFHLDHQFLLSHFETKIPSDFFSRLHVVEFFVSDVAYTIPETRYPKKDNEAYAYWILFLSNDPC